MRNKRFHNDVEEEWKFFPYNRNHNGLEKNKNKQILCEGEQRQKEL
jgi:hypothetical protein